MRRVVADEYLEKAKRLSKEEAEQVFSRMRHKLMRRVEDKETSPLVAVALQLEKEDEDLKEWRERWAEITAREKKKKDK